MFTLFDYILAFLFAQSAAKRERVGQSESRLIFLPVHYLQFLIRQHLET